MRRYVWLLGAWVLCALALPGCLMGAIAVPMTGTSTLDSMLRIGNNDPG
jgi:hypothetical protein